MTAPAWTVAVIGAGLMGHGIAQALAQAGHRIRITDTDPAARASVGARITRNLDEMGVAAAPVLARIQLVEGVADAVADADLVVESIVEVVARKQALFAEVAALVGPTTLLASNTSVIPITTLGEHLPDAVRARLFGMHWWNPPHLIPLVEVIRSPATRDEVVSAAMSMLAAAGKVPVLVRKDITGFIGNRLNQAMWREALALIEAGVCDAETIDTVVTEGFGRRLPVLGPMANADLIGLELTRDLHALLFPTLSTASVPSPLIDAAIAAGRTGMRAGAGLRPWTAEDAEAVRHRLVTHLLASRRDP